MAERVRIDAPAKINLRLCILAREQSGYHTLETLFCALSLVDEVDVQRAGPGITLRTVGRLEMGPPEQNLAARAASRFYAELQREAAVEIRLLKRIPVAAGLGGGSSDAAAVLRALNALHDDPLPREVLLRLASELGSDVPFFLCGSTMALAWGRGERLLALPPLPSRPVLVAHPGVSMPTARAFARLAASRDASRVTPAFAFELSALRSWDAVAGLAATDFEAIADLEVPALPRVRQVMRDAGARITMLAGSGSAIFGVFATPADRDAAEPPVRALGQSTWRAETLQDPPGPKVDPP